MVFTLWTLNLREKLLQRNIVDYHLTWIKFKFALVIDLKRLKLRTLICGFYKHFKLLTL